MTRKRMFVALKTGNTAEIFRLLDEGTDVNVRDEVGATILHYEAMGPNGDITRELLKRGADIEAKTYIGWTPLHYAVFRPGDVSHLRFLLESGANVNAETKDGQTPITFAVTLKNAEVVSCLLDYGAKFEEDDLLERAFLFSWSTENAKVLLDRGADPNSVDNCGQSILERVCMDKREYAAKVLLEYGANPNPPMTSAMTLPNMSLIDMTLYRDDPVMCALLMKYGAKPSKEHSCAFTRRIRTILALAEGKVMSRDLLGKLAEFL